MPDKNKLDNIHQGHRERIKDNFLEGGFDGFHNHEILEMLLFFGIPFKDTNEIAHRLVKTFGGFSNVLNADYDELVKVKGMTKNAAILINMIPQLLKRYVADCDRNIEFTSIKLTLSYFSAQYFGCKNEELKVCCLDDNMRVKICKTVSVGSLDNVEIDLRKIIEVIFRSNSNVVIIAHNHPNSLAKPSDEDINVTKIIKNCFDMLGITLLDHIIIGQNSALSMKTSGYFSLL